MKHLSCLLVVIFLTNCSGDREAIDYRPFYDLKGNVKQTIKRTTSGISTILGFMNSFTLDNETMTFNELGQLTKIETFGLTQDSTWIVISKDTFAYENGFLESEENYDVSNELQFSYQFTKHNEKGFPLEAELTTFADREKIVYEYEDGRIEKKTQMDGKLKYKHITYYDKNRQVILETLEEISDSGYLLTSIVKTFEYSAWDNFGNWTRRTIVEEKTGTTITEERELIYY